MASYATNAHVASEFKDITFSGTTKVTSTEVDDFIDQAEAEINARVGKKYEVPLTNASDILIARQIVVWMVSDRVRKIIQVKDIGGEELKQGVRPPGGRKEAMALLKEIVSGEMELASDLKSSHNGVKSFSVDIEDPNTFERYVDEW